MKTRFALMAVAAAAFAGLAMADDMMLKLSGDNEVPPVKTAASGSGTISVAADKTISGSVTTTGVQGTMAHIHTAEAGKNGPVTIPLSVQAGQAITLAAAVTSAVTQTGEYGWSVTVTLTFANQTTTQVSTSGTAVVVAPG